MNEDTNGGSPVGVGLNLTDIENVIQIIDYAANQGAYKGWDVIKTVQDVRTRLDNFLVAAKAAQKAQVSGTSED